MLFDQKYWDDRYINGTTGWNIGYPSTPIIEYIDQLNNQELKILIPGAGNAYEAEYLHKKGFTNVTVIDISPTVIKSFKDRVPSFPKENIYLGNFFYLADAFDLIIEQTFFCALDPNLRNAYAEQMHALLKPGGKLVGLLFDFPLNQSEPPFGGSVFEYESLFGKYFSLEILSPALNSIPPRQGRELFIKFRK